MQASLTLPSLVQPRPTLFSVAYHHCHGDCSDNRIEERADPQTMGHIAYPLITCIAYGILAAVLL